MGIVNYLTHLGIMVGIYGILSLTLNFQYGFTGLVNFGHVAFFAIGAYASTLLVLAGGTHFLVGLLGALVAGGIYGLIIALPTGNLKEDYWAIATLAAAASPTVSAAASMNRLRASIRSSFISVSSVETTSPASMTWSDIGSPGAYAASVSTVAWARARWSGPP